MQFEDDPHDGDDRLHFLEPDEPDDEHPDEPDEHIGKHTDGDERLHLRFGFCTMTSCKENNNDYFRSYENSKSKQLT